MECAPRVSTFFPFRVEHFYKGAWFRGKQAASHIDWQKIIQMYPVRLNGICFTPADFTVLRLFSRQKLETQKTEHVHRLIWIFTINISCLLQFI